MSTELTSTPVIPAPIENPQGNGDDQAQCKEEVPRDGVEDLTLDEEAEEQPPVGHNDVVRSKLFYSESIFCKKISSRNQLQILR